MASHPKPIKLVKKSQSAATQRLAEVVVENQHGWSRTIQSWVKEFRLQDRRTSLTAFDSLFKD